MRILAFLAVSASFLFSQAPLKVEPQYAGFSPERLERLRRHIRQSVEHKEFAGVNAAIAHKGKLGYSESFGFQDLEAKQPMRPDTIFRIASMTKPITSAAVMMLYEEGKFLLDEPVSKYIPSFAKAKVLTQENGDGAQVEEPERPISIRDLLTHTSGLSNSKAYRTAQLRSGTLRDMAEKLGGIPLAHQPGKAWRYGDSIDVLGYLIEVISGTSLDAFLQERMFTPLSMKDTGFYVPAAKLDRVAKSYVWKGDRVELNPQQGTPGRKPVFFSGSGGLYSTVPDYLRFCQMLVNGGLLDGKRLLSKATVDYMFLDHVPPGVMPANGPNGRKGYGFGIGGAILLDPAAAETLSTAGEFSWGGARYLFLDRPQK